MEKISLDLFTEYSFLSDLKAYKGDLIFKENKCDMDNNGYKAAIHKLNIASKKDEIISDFKEKNDFVILDEELYFIEKDEDSTTFKKGDEVVFKLPLSIGNIKELNDDYYLVSATIKRDHPDLYKYSEEEKKAYKKEKEANKDYIIFDEYPFFYNGAGIINGNRNALFLVDKKTYEIKRITSATMDVESFDSNGETIIFNGIDFEGKKFHWTYLYSLDVKSLKLSKLCEDFISIMKVFYDEDNIMVVASFAKEYGEMESPKLYKLVDNRLELVADPDQSFRASVGSDCRYGHGSNYIKGSDGASYIVSTYRERTQVFKVHKGNFEVYLDFPGSVDDMAIVDNKLYAIALMHQDLQEVIDTKKLEALTSINKKVLENKYVAKPIKVTVNKPMPIEGWVLLPKDYDETKVYPLILDIHGGPKTAYGEVFYHEMQYWANEGYFVIYCNPRGSDGYGNAFADLRRTMGTIDYEDIMDFVDEVLKKYEGHIDEKRMAVTGGSYGGYMTNWIIGHTDRFAAAATQRSISNWISMVCASDFGVDFPIEQEYDDVNNCHDELWDMSPLKYANNAKTPTLFIHSTEDYRCPIPEGIQLYTVLKCRGVDAKLVGFKGENHELSRSGKPLHRIKRLEEITNWIKKYTL